MKLNIKELIEMYKDIKLLAKHSDEFSEKKNMLESMEFNIEV